MTIESKLPTMLSQTTGSHAAGKSPAERTVDGQGGQSFAGLLDLQSMQDEALMPAATLTRAVDDQADYDKNMPLALVDKGLADIKKLADFALPGALPAVAVAATSPIAAGEATVSTAGVGASRLMSSLSDQLLVDADALSADAAQPDAPLDAEPVTPAPNRSSSVSRLLQIASTRLESIQNATLPLLPARSDLLAVAPTEQRGVLIQPGKFKQAPSSGATDGVTGAPGWFDKGISPTYAVVQAQAVVPQAKLAETVSYWVTQGVQQAELTLDGMGGAPVDVQITVDGDQARIDFRTAQPEMRQAIEAAASQLKGLLASEGLQLLGMSVGQSMQGQSFGDTQQPKPQKMRQTLVPGVAPLASVTARVHNAPVGQSLDLFV